MNLLPLPSSPVDQIPPRRAYGVRLRVSKVPRQSRGRAFLRRTASVDVIGPGGFALRTLNFGEDEPVTRETVLAHPRVRGALGEFGVQPSAVEILD